MLFAAAVGACVLLARALGPPTVAAAAPASRPPGASRPFASFLAQ